MKKVKLYWSLVVGMLCLGLTEALSGFVLWLGFPASGGGGYQGRGGGLSNLAFWDISKHTWTDIHDWVAVALVALVLVHILLHRKWIARMAKGLFDVARRKPAPVVVPYRD